jgi:TRAP-type C4-dicarboxylate transport system permease small subunit
MKKIFNIFDKALLIFVAIIGILMVIVGFMQVFFRYVLNMPLSWSEECVRYLFVWTTFLGAPVGIKRGGHASFDILPKKLPDKYQKPYRTILYLLTMIIYGTFVVVGFPFALRNMNQSTPALHIPYGLVSLAVPVGGVIGIIFCLNELVSLYQMEKGSEA